MPLTNTQLRYYDSEVLRLPSDKRKEYHIQVDHLITELSKNVRNKTDIKITKVVKAGSFAKHTILRKTSTDPVDVDVVFYISDRNINEETLSSLNETIYKLLIKIYPSKIIEDFELQRKAATITFVKSGLSVDVVPVIENVQKDGYGWQFDIHSENNVVTQTCAPCQIKFVKDRKDQDSDFRTLIRLAKRWRNHKELKSLKSFIIELIMAYLLDKEGASGSIEERFRRFLLYVTESGLKERIYFPENTYPLGDFYDPVIIIDPVYSLNNVAARITEKERLEIVEVAKESWETANFASVENDNQIWKEIFGPRFRVED